MRRIPRSAGIIRPLWAKPLKHLHGLIRKPNYFTYHRLASRLRRIPRHTPFTVKIHDWKLHLPDSVSFLSMYETIFLNQIYAFRCEGDTPRILDLGANVGLGVLFFKKSYPDSRITAFEPDPVLYNYLERNIFENGYNDVKLINKAAWTENTRLQFYSDGADGGYIVEKGIAESLEIDAIDISEFLAGNKFDFIKMDIEGAEKYVLPKCSPYLDDVKHIFIEYHSLKGEPQSFSQVINILAESGFRLYLQEESGNPSPLLLHSVSTEGFDFQANIFGWRD